MTLHICVGLIPQKSPTFWNTVTFVFSRSSVEVVELFEKGISILAFGGYIHSSKKATISLDMSFCYEGEGYAFGDGWEQTVEANSWSNIGIHAEQLINKDSHIIDATVKMTISSQRGNILDFFAFDFDVVSKEEFQDRCLSLLSPCTRRTIRAIKGHPTPTVFNAANHLNI